MLCKVFNFQLALNDYMKHWICIVSIIDILIPGQTVK